MEDSTKTTAVKIVEQDEPVPVVIADVGQPLPVEVVAENHDPHVAKQTISTYAPPQATVARADGMVASPTTTAEQDLVTKGQRSINLIWETTQSLIAITITVAVTYCDIMGIKTENLGKAFVLVIAIYFVRMNHIKIGGIGGTDSR